MYPSRFVALLVTLALVLVTAPAFADTTTEDHLNDARSLYKAGHWEDAVKAFEKAHGVADEGSKLKAAAALEWGSLLWEQGEYARAKQLVDEALELARELGLDDATGELLVALGHIEASQGKLAEAENTLNICVQITGELGDRTHRALCRLNRRTVRSLRGKDPGSDSEFRADVTTLREADTSMSVATSLAKTSQLYRDNNDFERAEALLDEAHEIYQRTGSVPAVTRNRLRQAQLQQQQGNFEQARRLTTGLYERFKQMKNRPLMVHTLALQAEDAVHQGDTQRGVSLYRRGLSTAEEINNPQLIGRLHLALCEMNFSGSPDHCQSATDIFESTQMVFLEIRARTALARTYQIQRKFEQSRATFQRAIAQLEEAVDTRDGAHAISRTLQYANLCQVEAQLQADGGLTTCTEALKGIDRLDDDTLERNKNLMAATTHAAARTAVHAGNGTRAVEHFTTAADQYETLGEPRHLTLAADILLRLGAVQNAMETENENAADTFRRGLAISSKLDLDDTDAANTHISLTTQLAQLLLRQDNWADAIELLEELTDLATEHGDDASAAWAYSGLARAYLKVDRRDDALKALETGRPLADSAGDDDLVNTFDTNLERLRD